MSKQKYENIELEIIKFDSEDVITTSNPCDTYCGDDYCEDDEEV